MRWSSERWVKLYTRDSTSWCLLSWQARGVMCLLMRAVDRDGVIDLGEHGVVGLAAKLRMAPAELEGPLAELVASRAVTQSNATIGLPNFKLAQETPTSNAERQRRFRESKVPKTGKLSRTVTHSNAASRTEQNRTEQSRVEETPEALGGAVQEVFAHWRSKTGVGPARPGKSQAAHIKARLTEGWSVSELKAVADGAAEDAKRWPERLNYVGVEVLYRNSDQVMKFVRLAPQTTMLSNGRG